MIHEVTPSCYAGQLHAGRRLEAHRVKEKFVDFNGIRKPKLTIRNKFYCNR